MCEWTKKCYDLPGYLWRVGLEIGEGKSVLLREACIPYGVHTFGGLRTTLEVFFFLFYQVVAEDWTQVGRYLYPLSRLPTLSPNSPVEILPHSVMVFGHEAFRGVDIMTVRPAGWDQQLKEEAQPSFYSPYL